MNKYEFLAAVRERLGGLSDDDIDRSLDYYKEMIDDRIEEGYSEEEAVRALGSIDNIVADIHAALVCEGTNVAVEVREEHSVPAQESGERKALGVFSMIAYVVARVIFYCVYVALDISCFSLALLSASILAYLTSFRLNDAWRQILILLGAVLVLAGAAVLGFIGLKYLKRLFDFVCGIILPKIRAMLSGDVRQSEEERA